MIIICIILFIVSITLMWLYITLRSTIKQITKFNIKYYVTKSDIVNRKYCLWIGKPIWNKELKKWEGRPKVNAYKIVTEYYFPYFGLEIDNFKYLKKEEIKEVFPNLQSYD